MTRKEKNNLIIMIEEIINQEIVKTILKEVSKIIEEMVLEQIQKIIVKVKIISKGEIIDIKTIMEIEIGKEIIEIIMVKITTETIIKIIEITIIMVIDLETIDVH